MDAELTFAQQVAWVVRKIPYGKVTSYGLIALALGVPGSARQVGWALNRHDDQPLPAHRVVNKQGYLSGGQQFGHPDVMKALLLAEGVRFREDDQYVVDMDTYLWDPSLDPEVMAMTGQRSQFDPPPDFPEE